MSIDWPGHRTCDRHFGRIIRAMLNRATCRLGRQEVNVISSFHKTRKGDADQSEWQLPRDDTEYICTATVRISYLCLGLKPENSHRHDQGKAEEESSDSFSFSTMSSGHKERLSETFRLLHSPSKQIL